MPKQITRSFNQIYLQNKFSTYSNRIYVQNTFEHKMSGICLVRFLLMDTSKKIQNKDAKKKIRRSFRQIQLSGHLQKKFSTCLSRIYVSKSQEHKICDLCFVDCCFDGIFLKLRFENNSKAFFIEHKEEDIFKRSSNTSKQDLCIEYFRI